MSRTLALTLALSLIPVPVATADDAPRIAIIIDDMGDNLDEGQRALELPTPVAFAMLPHTPWARTLAEEAHRQGHEILLHQPLEAVEPGPLGPGAITLRSGRLGVSRTLAENLAAVPHAAGVNNHMGSQLTRHPEYMQWLMESIRDAGELYFIDSRTTADTVALRMAEEVGIPATRRHVFLDDDPSPEGFETAFRMLREEARTRGYATAIGHPRSATLEILDRELPRLREEGFRIVSPSELIEHLEQLEVQPWRMSSSPSPKDSRRSKPSR